VSSEFNGGDLGSSSSSSGLAIRRPPRTPDRLKSPFMVAGGMRDVNVYAVVPYINPQFHVPGAMVPPVR